MALGDPFSTTYEGARQGLGTIGEGILQAAGLYAQSKKEEYERKRIRDEGQSLLQRFGIMNPNGTINTEKAQNMGVDIKSTGEVNIKPPIKQSKSSLEQIMEIEAVNRNLEDRGLSDKYQAVEGGTGNVQIKPKSLGFGQAIVKFSEDAAKNIIESVKKGDISGYLNSDPRTRAAVAAEAKKQNISLDSLVLGYGAEKTALGNVKILEAKVTTGNLAKTLIDMSYDPTTGNYNIPPSQHQELAIAVARLLSPSGQISEDMVNQLRQSTARQAFANVGIWFGLDPKVIGGPTQSVINLFANTIKRETEKAQQMRNDYLKGQVSTFEDVTQTPQFQAIQSGQQTQGKDTYGFSMGEVRYSKKYKRNLKYVGDNQWQ